MCWCPGPMFSSCTPAGRWSWTGSETSSRLSPTNSPSNPVSSKTTGSAASFDNTSLPNNAAESTRDPGSYAPAVLLLLHACSEQASQYLLLIATTLRQLVQSSYARSEHPPRGNDRVLWRRVGAGTDLSLLAL